MLYRMVLFPVTLSDPDYQNQNQPIFPVWIGYGLAALPGNMRISVLAIMM